MHHIKPTRFAPHQSSGVSRFLPVLDPAVETASLLLLLLPLCSQSQMCPLPLSRRFLSTDGAP
jgi:hypothetical protein